MTPPRPRPSHPISDRVLRSQGSNSPPPPTLHQLFLNLRQRILSQQGPGSFHVEGIAPEVGYTVARNLCEDGDVERANPRMTYNPSVERFSCIMPTQHHNTVATWGYQELSLALTRGFFTVQEFMNIRFCVGSRFDNFPAPWNNLYKEPDGAFVVHGARMPSVIIETGWTESWPKLQEDRTLWLQGGAPSINAVLLVKFSKQANGRVAASLEVHRPGGQQGLRLDVFPSPPPGTPPQQVMFQRRDFYPAGLVPAGRNPNDPWPWSVDNLRFQAREGLAAEGLQPV